MATNESEQAAGLAAAAASSTESPTHQSVVLFYKYFLSSPDQPSPADDAAALFRTHSEHYLPLLVSHQKSLCNSLEMRGRILLSGEGVNGTLSASSEHVLRHYIIVMEHFDLVKELGPPPTSAGSVHNDAKETAKASRDRLLFANIDWKFSAVDDTISSQIKSPFPDLKITAVKEIVSTGGTVDVDDIPQYGGRHLSPEEFHRALLRQDIDDDTNKEVVLIDCRNTFEHAIGHFVNPNGTASTTDGNATNATEASGQAQTEATPAINPQMTNFTQFDAQFCTRNASTLKNRKVLMYW